MPVRFDKRRGRWRYRKLVTRPDGVKVRIFGTPAANTRRAAERAERDHIERTLDPPPKETGKLTFDAFCDRWWAVYPASVGNVPSTRREKEIHLRVHLRPELGHLRLEQIRAEVVDRLFAKLRSGKPPLGEKTIKNVRATLRKILVTAVEWGELATVPPLPRVRVPDPAWDWYQAAETEQLLAAARSAEERTLIMFAARTGARAGEQLALEWRDLDFSSHLVVIRRSRSCHDEETGPTKSKKERRVPLSVQLEAALRAHRHLRGPLVFARDDGRPMSVYQLHERLWMCARKAGLRAITWHELRHSFASQLVSAGVPLPQVQEWLGHSTIAMTMRYAHLAPGASGRAQINALDAPGVAADWQRGNGETPNTDGKPRGPS